MSAAKRPRVDANLVDCLMIGTGEYTTGFVGSTADGASDSDKSAGVVALTLMDLRRAGKVGRLGMCGTNGGKFPAIRAHMQRNIGDVYKGFDLRFDAYPEEGKRDYEAYKGALADFKKGDAVTIFTPDDTHFEIALAAVNAGLHVLVTKPIVKTLAEHQALLAAAKEQNVLVMVEVHKRFDPIYADARDRIQALGGKTEGGWNGEGGWRGSGVGEEGGRGWEGGGYLPHSLCLPCRHVIVHTFELYTIGYLPSTSHHSRQPPRHHHGTTTCRPHHTPHPHTTPTHTPIICAPHPHHPPLTPPTTHTTHHTYHLPCMRVCARLFLLRCLHEPTEAPIGHVPALGGQVERHLILPELPPRGLSRLVFAGTQEGEERVEGRGRGDGGWVEERRETDVCGRDRRDYVEFLHCLVLHVVTDY